MTKQRTLTGETTTEARALPNTMLYCEQCGDHVLRSRADDHPHDLDEQDAPTDPRDREAEQKVPDQAVLDTQTYVVTFHDECVETVRVEASHRSEAKTKAEQQRTYDRECLDTLHTETRSVGDESQATIEYLEFHGLLPEDHDVRPADIQRVLDGDADA